MEKSVYDNAVNVLLDAYNNETLEHGNPCGCAIGNLVADANGFEIQKNEWDINSVSWKGEKDHWYTAMHFDSKETEQSISTGLSIKEVMEIEGAFEGCHWGYSEKEHQFNGLSAVLKVMETMVSEEVPHKENLDKLETIKNKFVCT